LTFCKQLALGLGVAFGGLKLQAGDWPQILGPHRNGVADGESLNAWGPDGPKTVWTHEVGEGYAGPAVQGDRVIVFHRVGDVELAEALDTNTGKPEWKTEFSATYQGGIDPDTGPRCVPLVHRGCVYLFGAAGDLHCVSLTDGKPVWTRHTGADFSSTEGYFGTGSTPIVSGGKLLVNVGGRNGAGIVALDLERGTTAWTATSEGASYSSPARTVIQGQEYAIFATRLNVVGLNPADGTERFRFPFGRRGPTVNAATPLVFDERLFVTASYGIGAQLVRLGGPSTDPVWSNDESLSSQYPTPVYHNGHLYGVHGREDVGVGELRCVDANTGKVKWAVPDFGMAHFILANDKLLVLTVQGRLLLVQPSPERFQTLASVAVSSHVTRALPALAHGRLFLRDNQGPRGTLKCVASASSHGR
jgi:outer membrane protein assembly factor BamB